VKGQSRSRFRPWTLAGIDLMAKGRQPKSAVMAAAMAKVPPGLAIRTHNRFRGNPRKMSTEHVITVGSRWVAGKNFTSMLRHGSMVEIVEDGVVYWDLTEKTRTSIAK